MNPNAFLKSLWRPEVNDKVFVAMSFDSRFDGRFNDVIRPAVEEQLICDKQLTAFRVDISKSGDSILTEINDGIAHSRLVLADVSVVDEGRFTELPVRNGNVMYEVGVALACRTPSEVLLIRDDSKKLLFDLSTIPNLQIDFQDVPRAKEELRAAIADRIKETDLINDARIQSMARRLSCDELRVLEVLAELTPRKAKDFVLPDLGIVSAPDERGLDGLLKMGCICGFGRSTKTDGIFYSITPFGIELARAAQSCLKRIDPVNAEA